MKKHFITFLLLLGMTASLTVQQNYQPTEANLKARSKFQDNKFRTFLHWGLYAMLVIGGWTMANHNLDYKEYARLAGGFHPSKLNADRWVAVVRAPGAKYICPTTRHHEGFSMFDTKYSGYNIIKATPFKCDMVKELAGACAKHGIKLHFYYLHIDQYHENAPQGRTGRETGRLNPKGDWKSYYQFMNNQLTELLTNYGSIGATWFNGWWDQDINPDFDWEFLEQYVLIHRLQPSCLVGNNHYQVPFAGEDIQIFERDLPGENTTGLSRQSVSHLPLETYETMNGMWEYKITDQNYKSTKTLIYYLMKAAGKDANLLMNIGPQPDGELPKVAVQRLKEVGDWMSEYGETIYGMRDDLVAPHDWGVTTQKGNKLYVHILNLQDKALFLSIVDKKVKKAVVFADKTPVRSTKNKEGVVLKLAKVPTDVDCVVELTID